MKSIDVIKLQSDMDEHGYDRKRLSMVLRCSVSTIGNIFKNESIGEDNLAVLQTIFQRPDGYYDAPSEPSSEKGGKESSGELMNLISQFSANTFAFQMANEKELKILNETMLKVLAAINDLKRVMEKQEGIANNNTGKITTAIAKVRIDTESIKTTASGILKQYG